MATENTWVEVQPTNSTWNSVTEQPLVKTLANSSYTGPWAADVETWVNGQDVDHGTTNSYYMGQQPIRAFKWTNG